MILSDPGPTPLDLRFRLFGTDVRVHPLFWLVSALFGWRSASEAILPGNGLGDVAVWIACAFFSILLHEFGHVWMGKIFGGRDQFIVLHSMGGLAFNATAPRTWQRVMISAAGPGIQLLLFGVLVILVASGMLVYTLTRPAPGAEPPSVGMLILQVALSDLLIMNLFWPLLNLLPVWPLDGGMMTREVFAAVSPNKGVIASLWVSLLVSAGIVLNALMLYLKGQELIPYVGRYFGGTFMALFFAMFAFTALQSIMQERQSRRRYWDDDSY